jgi:hypothetical protein
LVIVWAFVGTAFKHAATPLVTALGDDGRRRAETGGERVSQTTIRVK